LERSLETHGLPPFVVSWCTVTKPKPPNQVQKRFVARAVTPVQGHDCSELAPRKVRGSLVERVMAVLRGDGQLSKIPDEQGMCAAEL
jgi:hypothetical protein